MSATKQSLYHKMKRLCLLQKFRQLHGIRLKISSPHVLHIRSYVIFGSRIEVLLTPWGWRLHSLHRLPQLPEMAVVVLRGRGAAEDTVPVKIQEVAKRQEDYFVETLEIQQHNFFFFKSHTTFENNICKIQQ